MYVYCSCCNHKFGQYLSNQARPSPGETGLSSGVKQTATVYEMTSLCGASLSNILKRLNSVVNIDRVCSLFDQLTKKTILPKTDASDQFLLISCSTSLGGLLFDGPLKIRKTNWIQVQVIHVVLYLNQIVYCTAASVFPVSIIPIFLVRPSYGSLDSSFTRRFVWFVYCFPDAYFV